MRSQILTIHRIVHPERQRRKSQTTSKMSDGTGSIPRNTQHSDNISIESLAILFACCAGILLFLVICRTVINIIIIDVCILGDCTAWKKIFCCCTTWYTRDGGGNSSSRNRNRSRWRRRGDDDSEDDEHVDDGGSDDEEIETGRWRVFRRGMVGTITNPVSYIYNSPKDQRDIFLNSIIDSEVSFSSVPTIRYLN